MNNLKYVEIDGDKLRKAVKDAGYSLTILQNEVGMSDSYLSNAFNTEVIGRAVLLAICSLLKRETTEFLKINNIQPKAIKYDKRIRRGCIYELIERDGSHKNDILIISNDDRNCNSRLLSCIRINNANNGVGRDVVLIEYQKKIKLVHAELVTYVHRDSVGKELGKVSEPIMYEISEKCKEGLAL